jgi:predicted metal-binding protein
MKEEEQIEDYHIMTCSICGGVHNSKRFLPVMVAYPTYSDGGTDMNDEHVVFICIDCVKKWVKENEVDENNCSA